MLQYYLPLAFIHTHYRSPFFSFTTFIYFIELHPKTNDESQKAASTQQRCLHPAEQCLGSVCGAIHHIRALTAENTVVQICILPPSLAPVLLLSAVSSLCPSCTPSFPRFPPSQTSLRHVPFQFLSPP